MTIEKPRSGVAYADTAGYDAAAAAQYLAETGVFVGARVGTSTILSRTGR